MNGFNHKKYMCTTFEAHIKSKLTTNTPFHIFFRLNNYCDYSRPWHTIYFETFPRRLHITKKKQKIIIFRTIFPYEKMELIKNPHPRVPDSFQPALSSMQKCTRTAAIPFRNTSLAARLRFTTVAGGHGRYLNFHTPNAVAGRELHALFYGS